MRWFFVVLVLGLCGTLPIAGGDKKIKTETRLSRSTGVADVAGILARCEA